MDAVFQVKRRALKAFFSGVFAFLVSVAEPIKPGGSNVQLMSPLASAGRLKAVTGGKNPDWSTLM